MSEKPKRRAPAFPLYADDFLAGTSEMSAEEVGAYIRLLCQQWTKGGLPNDPDRLARMAGLMGSPMGSPSSGYVLAKFSLCPDGLLRNARLERIREEREEFVKKQSESGKIGALKRWGPSDPNGVAIADPMATHMANGWLKDSSPLPSPSPLPIPIPNTTEAAPSSLESKGKSPFAGFESEVRILDRLNELSHRNYRKIPTNLKLIRARLQETEVTVEGMLRMVERQVAKWNPDPKMREFLRPETLFGKEKFDGYYAAREEPILSQNRGGELTERQEGLRANLL